MEPSLATEGISWFDNLISPDPSLILPFALSGILFLLYRSGGNNLRPPRSAHTRQDKRPSAADPLLECTEEQNPENRSTSDCARHALLPQWHAAVLDLQQPGCPVR